MKRISKVLVALALPALLAFGGCSSGGADNDTVVDEDLGAVSEALGEGTCPRQPDEWEIGALPNDGKVPRSEKYSNPKCFKAFVVEIRNWATSRGDIVVTDAAFGKREWFKPSTSTEPRPYPFPTDIPFLPPAMTQAECESLSLKAILYEDGVQKSVRSSYGLYTPPVFPLSRGNCKRPYVVFGNASSSIDDVDDLVEGRTYTVAASLREGMASASPTRLVRVLTPPVACGESGLSCCGDAAATACDAGTVCSGNKCTPCGTPGGICCGEQEDQRCKPGNLNACNVATNTCESCGNANGVACGSPGNYWCNQTHTFLSGDRCLPCGGENSVCCPGNDWCEVGAHCEQASHTCRYPAPVDECAGKKNYGQPCCNGGCNGDLQCLLGQCTVYTPSTDSCAVKVRIRPYQCYTLDGTLVINGYPIGSEFEGCNLQEAKAKMNANCLFTVL